MGTGKKAIPPLVLEYLEDPLNMFILSVIEHKKEHLLCIIDDITPTTVNAFVIDHADREGINVEQFLSYAVHWFYSDSTKMPFSMYLTKRGIKGQAEKIYQTFNKAYISRIIGHPFAFNLHATIKKRKKRVKIVQPQVQIHSSQSSGVECQ